MEKWVKVAIGAVIAIISIGIIATSIYSMTQGVVKDEVVTFEVLGNDVTEGTYNLINKFALFDIDGNTTNIKSLELNNVSQPTPYYANNAYPGEISISNCNNNDFIIQYDDTMLSDGYDLQDGDIWVITFEVTKAPVISGVTATLLSLIPILFIGGIVYFTLSKREI